MKTNVLFLFCDEMRWDCLGVMGNPVIKTPSLDRLANEGHLFRNAYCTAPLCVPARAQIITGRSCWDSCVWGLGDRAIPSMRTFAHALNEQGYFTGVVGKMHFKPTGGGGSIREPHGFRQRVLSEEVLPEDDLHEDDYWQYLDKHGYGHLGRYCHGYRSPDHFEKGYQAQVSELPLRHFDTVWTADETIKMIEEQHENPFFIWCSFVKPHFPCELPKDWPCPYSPEEIPLRQTYSPDVRIEDELFPYNRSSIAGSLKAGWLDEKTCREFAAYYYGNITLIDIQVGRILDKLDELGLRDKTLIVFSSDHGEGLGERGMFGKYNFYDESCRVPMILSGPAVKHPGAIDERPIILEDLCPTFLEAASCGLPDYLIGQSMLPLLEDLDHPGRDAVFGIIGGFYHFEPENAHCFVVIDNWKYMYQFDGAREALFDTAKDPLEMENLASANPDVCDRLNREVANWFKEKGAGFLVHHQTGRLRSKLNY